MYLNLAYKRLITNAYLNEAEFYSANVSPFRQNKDTFTVTPNDEN